MSVTNKINFLASCFKKAKLANDKINAEVLCPNKDCKSHRENKLKFIVQLDTQQFNCWVCGLSGVGVLKVVKKYVPSKASICEKVFLRNYKETKVEKEEIEVKLPENVCFLAESQNSYDPDIRSIISYAKRRGLKDRDFWYFKLCAAKTGRLKQRVIIPSFDKDGKLNYYVARSIFKDNKFKYINAKVPKKEVIFNEINIDWSKELTLVEGPFDLLKSNENSTCLLGCSLKEDQPLFKKIVKNNTDICLALDPDVIDKSYKIARLLSSYGINVRILDCSGYEDVGEMTNEVFTQKLKQAKSFALDDRLLNLISSIKSGSMI